MRRIVVLSLVVSLSGILAGQVFAAIQPWESRQNFQTDTLHGQSNGRSWSPTGGILSGEAHVENNARITYAEVSNHAWNTTAINWMRNNSGTPSITFHAFNWNNGCTQWVAEVWAGTNLPGSTYERQIRPCGINEIRVRADKFQLVANTGYIAQVRFRDTVAAPPSNPTGSEVKITTDTYWDGSENYHQHYCIKYNVDTALSRGVNGCPG